MKAKHSKGKRYRAKGRTASRAVNAARRLKIIPIITRDMNRIADWLNATGVVQVAIIEAVQHYIDQVQACQPLDGFKLTDKVNDIVQAHIKAQQAVQPITEPGINGAELIVSPATADAANAIAEQLSHATEPVKDEAGNAVDPATVDAVNALSEQISHATEPAPPENLNGPDNSRNVVPDATDPTST